MAAAASRPGAIPSPPPAPESSAIEQEVARNQGPKIEQFNAEMEDMLHAVNSHDCERALDRILQVR